jgi:hypothetical protein
VRLEPHVAVDLAGSAAAGTGNLAVQMGMFMVVNPAPRYRVLGAQISDD